MPWTCAAPDRLCVVPLLTAEWATLRRPCERAQNDRKPRRTPLPSRRARPHVLTPSAHPLDLVRAEQRGARRNGNGSRVMRSLGLVPFFVVAPSLHLPVRHRPDDRLQPRRSMKAMSSQSGRYFSKRRPPGIQGASEAGGVPIPQSKQNGRRVPRRPVCSLIGRSWAHIAASSSSLMPARSPNRALGTAGPSCAPSCRRPRGSRLEHPLR